VNPCDALAELARYPSTRSARSGQAPSEAAPIAWAAINRTAVAIVIIGPSSASGHSEVLHSRLFTWDSSAGAVGSQARLLQRYSLVAHLAPELQRAMTAVASSHGARIDTIVTCGNVPDLRSLTMPLIEELDVEVETLDSLDGLDAPAGIRDRLGELAPATRLATAAALAPRDTSATTPVAALAAAAAVIAAAGTWYWYTQQRAQAPSTGSGQAPAKTTSSPAPPPVPSPTVTKPSASPTMPSSTPPNPRATAQQAAAPLAPKKASTPPPPSRPAPTSGATAGAVATTKANAPATAASPPASKPAPAASAVKPAPRPADKPHASAPAPAGTIEPLTDPLPTVNTILVSPERRFAVLNGRVVSVGDAIGPRVVAAIEPREVVLQEPSGVQIRVGLGGRVLGIIRPGPR
jgi:hypothetical protein